MSEADKIKIALYKTLLRKIDYSQIIIPEIFIGKAIADVLIANNNDLHIYEIKSKNDSLARLENQINRYKQCANRVTIIADEKFLSKLEQLDYIENVGIMIFDKKGQLHNIKEPLWKKMTKDNYFSYWSPIEFRETLRGFPKWYEYTTHEAIQKLNEILSEDETKRLTLFRLKEKYIKEFIIRRELILEKKYIDALQKRFQEKMDSLQITPLLSVPYSIFRDF